MKLSLNEGFGDVFDSSLIDYSNDFENSDNNYNELLEFHNKLNYYGMPRGEKNNLNSVNIDDLSFILPIDKHEYLWNKAEIQYGSNNNIDSVEMINDRLCSCYLKKYLISIDGSTFGFTLAIPKIETTYYWLSFVVKGIFGRVYKINENKNSEISATIFKRNIEKLINSNVNESFSDVFDSSLIDYHEDFEKQDEEYQKKQEIIEWLIDTVSIYNCETGEKLEIEDGKGINLLKMTVYTPGNPEPSHHYAIDINGDLEFNDAGIEQLPDYIRFHTCKGYFNANGVTFKSLKGFPSQINGDFRICFSAIKSFKDGPELVGQDLHCKNNPQLKGYKALNGFPKKVAGDIFADPKLEKYIYSDAYGGNDGWY